MRSPACSHEWHLDSKGMSDLPKPRPAPVERDDQSAEDAEMARLRRLLLGEDYERLSAMRADLNRMLALYDELGDPAKQANRVAVVLSEAVLLREHQDHGVSKALRPAIADSIKASVRKDPQPLVDAISPIIGPAIRRAVNEAIAGVLQVFDKLLEHSFSWRALKWRFEAWRTGSPYAEVVLFHTLTFWVEQVFLIHRETGLLLQHVTSRQGGIRDPDLIGSMLTAITDFVSDSFSDSADAGSVQSMQVGDHRVMVEQGRLAFIAAVTRGNPSAELTTALQETLETVHLLYRGQLERFDGDAAPFAETHGLLEDCLQRKTKPESKRRPWIPLLLLGLLVFGPLGYLGYQSHQRYRVWDRAMDKLRVEPGIVVTDAVRDGDLYRVEGLRDPIAREPLEVIGPQAATELQWDWRWKPYLSFEEGFLLTRARQALQAPETVVLSVNGDLLELSGEAPRPWVDTMRDAVLRIPGIAAYRDDELRPVSDSTVDRDALVDEQQALSAGRAELAHYRDLITATEIYFRVGSMKLQQDQSHVLDMLATEMKALVAVADDFDLVPRFLVTGYADTTGTQTENLRLSLLRARAVIIGLVARGVNDNLFLPIKLGVNSSAQASDPEVHAGNRRVTLDFIVPSGI